MSVIVPESNEMLSLIMEVQKLKEELQKERSIKQEIRVLLERALLLTENDEQGKLTRTSSVAPYIPIPTRFTDIDIVHIDEKINDCDISFEEGCVDSQEEGLGLTVPPKPLNLNSKIEYLETEPSNLDAGYSDSTPQTVIIEEKDKHNHIVVIPDAQEGLVRQDDDSSASGTITYQGETNVFSEFISNRAFWKKINMGGSFRLGQEGKSPPPPVADEAASVNSMNSESLVVLPKKIRKASMDSGGSYSYVSNARSDARLLLIPTGSHTRKDPLRLEIENKEQALSIDGNENKVGRENTKKIAPISYSAKSINRIDV